MPRSKTTQRDPILALVFERAEKIGGVRALAERLGIHRVAVYQWRRVPEAHVREVGEILHIAKNRLRPDLYD